MSRTMRAVLIVVAVVLVVLVGLHLVAEPMMSSLREAIHGR